MQEAISLGWNCESASRSVQSGIRSRKANGYKTCPFDECITNYEGLLLCLEEDFQYFCDVSCLKIIPAMFSTGGIVKGEPLLYNTRYKFIFNHESPAHANLWIAQRWPGGRTHYIANNYALFIERYARRIQNFREYLRTSGLAITFVIGKFDPDVSQLRDCLSAKYPSLQFTIDQYVPSVSQQLFDDHHTLMKHTGEA